MQWGFGSAFGLTVFANLSYLFGSRIGSLPAFLYLDFGRIVTGFEVCLFCACARPPPNQRLLAALAPYHLLHLHGPPRAPLPLQYGPLLPVRACPSCNGMPLRFAHLSLRRRYSSELENTFFKGRAADYLFMFIFGAACLLARSLLA